MDTSETIVVVGATGAQGGGLVRAILDDPKRRFRARAVTRNSRSDRASALARLGAEPVEADLDDVDSLKRVFENAHGAYCMTNFWEHFSPDKEVAQATNMAQAAQDAGLEHVIWSTLEDTRRWVPLDDDRMPTLMQRYKVPHFDAKAEAAKAFTAYGVHDFNDYFCGMRDVEQSRSLNPSLQAFAAWLERNKERIPRD